MSNTKPVRRWGADDISHDFSHNINTRALFIDAFVYDRNIKTLEEAKENSSRIDREQREQMQTVIDRLVDERDEQAKTIERQRGGHVGTLVAADVRARTITLSVPFEAFRTGEMVTGREYSIINAALKEARG